MIERVVNTPDGRRVLFRVRPLSSVTAAAGIMLTFTDVTSVQTLTDANQMLSDAIRQARAPIVLIDTRGNITYANPAFARQCERDEKFLAGTHIEDLTSEYDRKILATALEGGRQGESWLGALDLVTPSGRNRLEWVKLSALRDASSNIVGAVRFSEDPHIFRAHAHAPHVGYLAWNTVTSRLYLSHGVAEIWPEVSSGHCRSLDDLLVNVDDASRPLLRDAFRKATAYEEFRNG